MSAESNRPGRGRSWTQQDSDTVRRLLSAGVSRRQIAAEVGCSPTTLRRRFAAELAGPGIEGEPRSRRQVSLLAGEIPILLRLERIGHPERQASRDVARRRLASAE